MMKNTLCLLALTWLGSEILPPTSAVAIVATCQNTGDPTHATGNLACSIDVLTGVATPISLLVNGSTRSGLAGSTDGHLLDFQNGSVVEIDPFAGTLIVDLASMGLEGCCGVLLLFRGRAVILSL